VHSSFNLLMDTMAFEIVLYNKAAIQNYRVVSVCRHKLCIDGVRPRQNTPYPLPVPELPEPEVSDPKFG
jgi:hypothetical protein